MSQKNEHFHTTSCYAKIYDKICSWYLITTPRYFSRCAVTNFCQREYVAAQTGYEDGRCPTFTSVRICVNQLVFHSRFTSWTKGRNYLLWTFLVQWVRDDRLHTNIADLTENLDSFSLTIHPVSTSPCSSNPIKCVFERLEE